MIYRVVGVMLAGFLTMGFAKGAVVTDDIATLMDSWAVGHYLSPDIACAPEHWDRSFANAGANLAEGRLSLHDAQRRLQAAAPGIYFTPFPEKPYETSTASTGGANALELKGKVAIVRLRGSMTADDWKKWEALGQATTLIFDLRSSPGEGIQDLATRSGIFESPAAVRILGQDLARLPPIQTVDYRGFPSEIGFSSGYYQSAIRTTVTSQETAIVDHPAGRGTRTPSIIVIGNGDTMLPRVILAARFRGRAHFITTGGTFQYGGLPSTASRADAADPILRLARFDGYDLVRALQPDASVTDACVDSASCLEKLTGERTIAFNFSRSSQCTALPSPDPSFNVDAPGLPEVEARFYAMAKAYEVLRMFHPRGTEIGKMLRRRLGTAVRQALSANSATEYAMALSRFTAGTGDTHVEIVGRSIFQAIGLGNPPIHVALVEDRLVVTCTGTGASGIQRGDEVVTIDGIPAMVRLTNLQQILSAQQGQRGLEAAARYSMRGSPGSTVRLVVRSDAGIAHKALLPRGPLSQPCDRGLPSQRTPFEWLGPGTAYVDLSRLQPAQIEALAPALATAKSLIVDLRGYPLGGAWTLSAHRTTVPSFPVARFETPLVASNDADTSQYRGVRGRLTREQWARGAREPLVTAKTFVLVDRATLSQGEHSVLLLRAAAPVTLVGRATGGADGDVTGTMLPGRLALRFTGQEVKTLEGATILGSGLIPDKMVPQTMDRVLLNSDAILDAALKLAQ